jgi:hypothetical protein
MRCLHTGSILVLVARCYPQGSPSEGAGRGGVTGHTSITAIGKASTPGGTGPGLVKNAGGGALGTASVVQNSSSHLAGA